MGTSRDKENAVDAIEKSFTSVTVCTNKAIPAITLVPVNKCITSGSTTVSGVSSLCSYQS